MSVTLYVPSSFLSALSEQYLYDELPRHRLHAADRLSVLLVSLGQLPADRLVRDYHVVSVEDEERLVGDEVLRREYGVTETLRLLLSQEIDVGNRAYAAHLLDLVELSGGGELLLVFNRVIEIILDGVLPASGDTRMSSAPEAAASSTRTDIAGRSTTGSISFGTVRDIGSILVPSPAAGITALRIFCIGFGSFLWDTLNNVSFAAWQSVMSARHMTRDAYNKLLYRFFIKKSRGSA